MSKKSAGLFVGASLLITLLSGSFLFLAPIPARYLHMNHGRLVYWAFTAASSLLLAFAAPQWAIAHAAVLILMGLFTELEEQKFSTFYSAGSAILLTGLVVFLSVLIWGKLTGISTLTALKANVSEVVAQYKTLRGAKEPDMDVATVLSLMPAIAAGSLMIMVFVGTVFVRTSERVTRALQFSVPPYFIWVFIGSLAGTFLLDPIKHFYVQKTMSNILFFALAAYYFQGLAIMGFYFKKLRINYFLRTVLFFAIGIHLFIFVAGLGLSDLWFEYRSKVLKTRLNSNEES